MGTITGQSLADNAAGLLHDVAKTRWTDADYLIWLNDAQRQATIYDSAIFTTNTAVLLSPSSTKQTLPAGGNMLVSLVRNMGSNGTTPGRAIAIASRDHMDVQVPEWHTDLADPTNGIANYMFDPRDNKTFYVYPQAPATAWYVEMVYHDTPPALAQLADPIGLDDQFANALLDYLLYRAYMRDNVYGELHPAAQQHFVQFVAQLGSNAMAEMMTNPNLMTSAFQRDTAGAAGKPA